MDATMKKKRGRPKKPNMTLEEEENAVILKYLNGEPMTLDETALAVWMAEGRKTKRPMTKVAILGIEAKALAKLKVGLKKFGIDSLDDVLFPKGRSNAASKFSAPESED